jgi:hypothetical protein
MSYAADPDELFEVAGDELRAIVGDETRASNHRNARRRATYFRFMV